MDITFPPHKGSLCLEHNPHLDSYETVGDWLQHPSNRNSSTAPSTQ